MHKNYPKCDGCGKDITRRKDSRKPMRFCGVKCSGRVLGEERRRFRPTWQECPVCKKRFMRKSHWYRGIHCGNRCAAKARVGPRPLNATSRWDTVRAYVRDNPEYKACLVCGATRSGNNGFRLSLHHIEHRRHLSDLRDLSTVVALCRRHHQMLEPFTEKLEWMDPKTRRAAALELKEILLAYSPSSNSRTSQPSYSSLRCM